MRWVLSLLGFAVGFVICKLLFPLFEDDSNDANIGGGLFFLVVLISCTALGAGLGRRLEARRDTG